jgi:hypothetical protein
LAGIRKKIHPATEAALWALSNGRCYAPGCSFPVIVEIRPGVYRKNAQVAHIKGVRAPRFDPSLTAEQCAAFSNLLLLCLPHHAEVYDLKTGEKLYPVKLLRQWKINHEGSNWAALAALGQIDEEILTDLLLDVFTPPVKRLQQIADQLEETGTLNAHTVKELRQVVEVMINDPYRPDPDTAAMLAEAAEVYGSPQFLQAAELIAEAAETLPGYDRTLGDKINELHEIADVISVGSRRMARYSEDW